MQFDSPILAAILMPVLAWVAWRAARFETAARWLVRVTAVLLITAVAGPEFRCARQMDIVVWVDVSSSTRTATYHDQQALSAKLSQLIPGQTPSIRYFADGQVHTPSEHPTSLTQLPGTAADAIILFSDGRLIAPGSFPPVFPVIDPALHNPPDAKIAAIVHEGDFYQITTDSTLNNNQLTVQPGPIPTQFGSGRFTLPVHATSASITASIQHGDSWPENDSMSLYALPQQPAPVMIVQRPDDLPSDLSAYLAPAAILINASHDLSPAQQSLLVQYVRDLGGTLILSGKPSEYPANLRPIAPLTATPPVPQSQWMILIDASGSMDASAGSVTRWDRAVSAAIAATAELEGNERLSVATFARNIDLILDAQSPSIASGRIEQLRTRRPSGPTGLESALQSLVQRKSDQPTRLLLITDADATLTQPDALIKDLKERKISIYLLATSTVDPTSPLRNLCQQTGGMLISETDPTQWPTKVRNLTTTAKGSETRPGGLLTTTSQLADLRIEARQIYGAFARDQATLLATYNDTPAVAIWHAGLGKVVSIAAEIELPQLEKIAERLRQTPADPRFTIHFDLLSHTVQVMAQSPDRPLNQLQLTLRTTAGSTPFSQIAPGHYQASVTRQDTPAILQIYLGDQIVQRLAVASRYAREFDAVGNDYAALRDFADRTGGRVIESGDNTPIQFNQPTEWRSLRAWFSIASFIAIALAMVMIRMPYLAQRVTRYIRRSVR